VDEQALDGVADRRALHFPVQGDRHRLLLVGALVEVEVTDALVMLYHRDARALHHGADQRGAPSGDAQVDELVEPEELVGGLAVRGGNDLHRGGRQPRGGEPFREGAGQGEGGPERV